MLPVRPVDEAVGIVDDEHGLAVKDMLLRKIVRLEKDGVKIGQDLIAKRHERLPPVVLVELLQHGRLGHAINVKDACFVHDGGKLRLGHIFRVGGHAG